MNSLLHKQLLADVSKLRRIVSDVSLRELVNFVAHQHFIFNKSGVPSGRRRLSSPLRQGVYLLSVACSLPEPVDCKALDDGKYDQIVHVLERIFSKYMLAYFPMKNDPNSIFSGDWKKHRDVAAPAFINYFMAGPKLSTTDIKEWVGYCFDGFEQEVSEKYGMTPAVMLRLGDFFEKIVLSKFDELQALFELVDNGRRSFIDKITSGVAPEQALAESTEEFDLGSNMSLMLERMNDLYSFDASELEGEFGEDVRLLVYEHFVTFRGQAQQITYITDESPVLSKPLLTVDGEKLFFLSNNSFYISILNKLERHLSSGEISRRYLRERDVRLESKVVSSLRRIFPPSASFYPSAFESPKAHFEHDLVIVHERSLFIVEAKASPPKEPLRDPSKAYERINDHFRGRNGIQKAYEQANSLKRNFISNGSVELFSKKGELLVKLLAEDFENIYCFCVTRDDFGVLATNLSLLLKKELTDPYPWVVSVSDLECLINGFLHLGKGFSDLVCYVEQRVVLHGKVFGADELEYAGAFLKYGGLEDFISANADFIPLDISESDIFDEIYYCELDGKVYELEVSSPGLVPFNRSKIFGGMRKGGKNKVSKKIRNIASSSKRKNRGK
ncbi:NERD domain-containing protein [Pseudomonas sp. MAC6]|uniref:NERD domain-containing protein n=1 Tax=Pseudomonas sp. MAC6 TaxID=3401633 RepID=UPI003BF47F67